MYKGALSVLFNMGQGQEGNTTFHNLIPLGLSVESHMFVSFRLAIMCNPLE